MSEVEKDRVSSRHWQLSSQAQACAHRPCCLTGLPGRVPEDTYNQELETTVNSKTLNSCCSEMV